MRPQHSFERITTILRDGSWHELEDVRAATSFPEEWVKELRAEGVVDVEEEGATRVRLVEPHAE